jgi:hypothetical protein
MPRKKLVRRCEPRYAISREMLEQEAKYVAHEVEDYLLLSIDDLKERLVRMWKVWDETDQTLEGHLVNLGDAEKLALQCLIIRDMYHLMELYLTHLRSSTSQSDALAPPKPSAVVAKALPRSEWLFDMES